MPKHEGPKDASEIRVCYTPKEYIEAGREIMKVYRDIFLEKKKKKNLGQRICGMLRIPEYQEIGASEWLLLFIIYKYSGNNIDYIQCKISEYWKEIHSKNPNFYIVWPREYNLWQEMIRFESIELIEICECKSRLYWRITKQGIKCLHRFKKMVRPILGEIVDSI